MIEISPIPAFNDNYVWMISSGTAPEVVVVDPGEAAPVLQVLGHQKRRLAAILLTHHHGDHVGGVGEILAQHPAPVFGPARETIDTVNHPVSEGDTVSVPEPGIDFAVRDVPGHTAGHVAYTLPGTALVGDTMFAGGCGRVFEGTPEQMHDSLRKLADLAHVFAVADIFRNRRRYRPRHGHMVECVNVRMALLNGLPILAFEMMCIDAPRHCVLRSHGIFSVWQLFACEN